MAARQVTIKDRNWYKEVREPMSKQDHIVVVDADKLDAVKGLPKVLTVKKIADFLHYSSWAIYQWCKEWDTTGGKSGLKHQTIRGRIRVFREDLAAFLMMENLTSKA